MKRVLKILGGIIVVLAIAYAAFMVWAYRPVPTFEPLVYDPVRPSYWPTTGWNRSTPEAQGMRSEVLLEMAEFIRSETEDNPEFCMDSVTVIRNGHIVAEIYPNPNYPRDEMHVIHSATKSIVAILIGIAIEDGKIGSVDDKLVDFFPERTIQNLDDAKRAITLRDLLSMETGLHSRDSYLYAYEGLFELQKSDDWVQFALDLPMAATPGARFDYSNASTFLLGAVLARATDTDVLSYARKTLFEPLGITDVRWEWTKDNLPIAWARMWLKPDDLAKIGLMLLQQGHWDGEQIVSPAWIRDSLTPWAYPKNAVDILNKDHSVDRDASSQNWVSQRFFRAFADGYGYQIWLDRNGNYTALGTNGQYLTVVPQQNVIFVSTGKHKGLGQFAPAKLLEEFVLPAIAVDGPLPAANATQKALAILADPPERQATSRAIVDVPANALMASGTTFAMDENPFKTNNIRFHFDPSGKTVEVSYTSREDWAPTFDVGLDGVPRKTETDIGTFVAHGEWTGLETLEVHIEIVGYTSFDKWEFRFEEGALFVTEHSITGVYTYSGRPAAP